MSLLSNEHDIAKAIKQGEQARRMADAGIDLYERFMELNEIIRNIRASVEVIDDA